MVSSKETIITGPLGNPRDSTGSMSESAEESPSNYTPPTPPPPPSSDQFENFLTPDGDRGQQGHDIADVLQKMTLKTEGLEDEFSKIKNTVIQNEIESKKAADRIQNLSSQVECIAESLDDFMRNIGTLSRDTNQLYSNFKAIQKTSGSLKEDIMDTKIGLSSQLQAFISSTEIALAEVKEENSELKGMCLLFIICGIVIMSGAHFLLDLLKSQINSSQQMMADLIKSAQDLFDGFETKTKFEETKKFVEDEINKATTPPPKSVKKHPVISPK